MAKTLVIPFSFLLNRSYFFSLKFFNTLLSKQICDLGNNLFTLFISIP